ncbi:MAG: hypothetical protein ACP5NZ_03315 [Nanobdellota archaeon]
MKSDKSLVEKLKDAEKFLPCIQEKLKREIFGQFDMHWITFPTDVEFLETDKYKIVASKFKEESFSDMGGGASISGWITIYYVEDTGKIKEKKTEILKTAHSGWFGGEERSPLSQFDYVKLRMLGEKQVEVAWVDERGKYGPVYKLDLH